MLPHSLHVTETMEAAVKHPNACLDTSMVSEWVPGFCSVQWRKLHSQAWVRVGDDTVAHLVIKRPRLSIRKLDIKLGGHCPV